MSLPDGPYTYDDPRIGYDEHCFFYDGGYDSVCLAPPEPVIIRRRGGLNTSSRRRKDEEERDRGLFLNLFIQANLKEVNGSAVPFDPDKGWIRFSGENLPLAIVVHGIKINMDTPYVEGYLRELATKPTTVESVNATIQIINNSQNLPNITTDIQPIEDTEIQVQTLEPYQEDLQVSCELIPENTDLIVVSSPLIKKNNE